MSLEVLEQAHGKFIDGKYDDAYVLFTQLIENCNADNNLIKSRYLCYRAECSLKLTNYDDALVDCIQALLLDENNLSAYLRKGVSLYNLNRRDEAFDCFSRGLSKDDTNEQLREWYHKCEDEQTAAQQSGSLINRHDVVQQPLGQNQPTPPITTMPLTRINNDNAEETSRIVRYGVAASDTVGLSVLGSMIIGRITNTIEAPTAAITSAQVEANGAVNGLKRRINGVKRYKTAP